MEFCEYLYLAYFLALISMVLHGMVVYYGIKLIRFLGYVKYWTKAWKLFTLAQFVIFVRRGVGFYALFFAKDHPHFPKLHFMFSPSFPFIDVPIPILETLLTIFVSILILCFGKGLAKLFVRQFYINGFEAKEED